jgi:sugar lactone lactonase YvrE
MTFTCKQVSTTGSAPRIRSSVRRALLKTALLSAIAGMASHALVPTQAYAQAASPAQIRFSGEQIYPESVAWSAKQKTFFVGSVRHGVVGKVSLDGTYTPFITDQHLITSLGILVDDAHDTLWVAIADPGVSDRTSDATKGKLAAVATFDSRTGALKAYYDLGKLDPTSATGHFANDLALDKAGNAYVVDSFAPDIYRIGTEGSTSLWAQNPAFHDGDGFNLNGIAFHKDGFLLVGKYNTGDLFRIPLADPTHFEKVSLSEPLKGADGFHLVDPKHLVLAQNMGADRVVELVSTDGWKTAHVTRQQKTDLSMPSAVTQVGKNIYVLDSRIDNLFDPKQTKVNDFELQKF